jgi:hypothetical protein
MRRPVLPALAVVALSAAPLHAQQFLDAGTFLLMIGGAEAGRVEYAIRPNPSRQGEPGVLLVATARLRGRELQHALELSATHVPVSFQQTETVAGRPVRRVAAQLAGTRFSIRVTSADGESAREFPVRPPVSVLGDEDYAGFYFVPRAEQGAPRSVTIVRALDARAVQATVENQGPDTVTVGEQTLGAQRFVLRMADGDERAFWFTSGGDLLRVANPRQGLVATRAGIERR